MAQITDFTFMVAEDFPDPDEVIEPPATFKSAVWKYFKLTKSRKHTVCNICNIATTYSGNTTNLQTHLRRHHPHIEINLGQNNCSGGSNLTKSSPLNSVINVSETSSNDSILSLSGSKLVPIASGVSSKGWLTTDAITKFLASDLRPFSVIEDPGFRNLIHTLDPTYTIPSVHYFSEVEVPRLYRLVRGSVKDKVSSAERVALAANIWTSASKQNHVTVTCHFLNSDWQIKSFVLQTCILSGHFAGREVGEILQLIISEWDFKDVHPAVVTDHDMELCPSSDVKFSPHHVCFARTLDSAAYAGLHNIGVDTLLSKVRRVVTFFYRNENAASLLKRKQETLDLPQKKLELDCPSRSISSYVMMESFLEQKSAIYAVLASKELRKEAVNVVMPTENEVAEVECLVELMKPLKMATQAICEKSAPTLSVIAPLLSQLKGIMQSKDEDSDLIKHVKKAIIEYLKTCHTGDGEMEFLHIASALDPRFKTLPFLSDIKRLSAFSSLAVKATELHEAKQKQVKTNDPSSSAGSSQSSSCSLFDPNIQIKQEPSDTRSGLMMFIEAHEKSEWDQPPAKKSALSSLFGDVFVEQSHQPKSILTSAQEEVDRYKIEIPTPLECNPLIWWKDHEGAYPLLAALARSILCIPAVTVNSEQVFSYSGDMYDIQRQAIDCSYVDTMIFLKKNLEFV